MRQTFTWFPDIGGSVEEAPSVSPIKFGEGYEVRIPEGLNRSPETWKLTFSVPHATAGSLLAFLREHGAYKAFNWTTPEKRAGVFVCRQWSRVRHTGYVSITAEFQEVFEA